MTLEEAFDILADEAPGNLTHAGLVVALAAIEQYQIDIRAHVPGLWFCQGAFYQRVNKLLARFKKEPGTQ